MSIHPIAPTTPLPKLGGVARRGLLVALLAPLAVLACARPAAAAAGDLPNTRLFSQDADRGSLVPTGNRRGEYTMTLRGVAPRSLWFENRPGKRQGAISNSDLLNLLFGERGGRTAAVDAWDPRRREDVVMGVELLGGSWNPAARVLRYRVLALRASSPHDADRVGAPLPRHFGEAGIFVDEVCPAPRCAEFAGETGPGGERIGKVFVQDATRGTIVPAAGGAYRLVLRGVDPRLLWFQDRPGVPAGTAPQRVALDPFFSRPGEAPPNAAIDAWVPGLKEDVTFGIKVLDGRWDPRRRVLRYSIRPLREADGSRPVLPRRLGQAGVYLDDCDVGCQSLIKNLTELYEYLDRFFTERHTCTGILSNVSGAPIYWHDDISGDHDSWQIIPDRTISYNQSGYLVTPGIGAFSTVAAWLRGCYVYVHYNRGQELDVHIGIEDPYHGPNEWGCSVSPGYRCYLERGNYGGDHVILYYCVLASWAAPYLCPFTDEP